jgi:hypothetical protein
MMDERRRFQIALGGIATCLLIAALFVSSAPPLSYPVVPHADLSAPAPLVGEFMPPRGLPELPPTTPSRSALRTSRGPLRDPAVAENVVAQHVTTSPVMIQSVASAPLETRAPQIAPTGAPTALAGSFAMPGDDAEVTAEASDDRSPVTGAFVSVGREVGHGFRTAGRAIKSIF